MRVLVCGAGAVGSVLGGLLAAAGHAVTLWGRAWHLEAVRADGLRISGLWGARHVRALATAETPDAIPRTPPFDWLFVCVKAHTTAALAPHLPALMGPDTLVCAFQNGLGNDDALQPHVPPARLALGRVIFGAEIIAPGHVRVTVSADDVLIGAPVSRVPAAPLAALAAALDASGIPARTTDAIVPALWGKVLYNCALNGLATLLEVPYGRVPDHPAARRLMEQVVREAYAVAAARDIPLVPPTPAAYWELLLTRLLPPTAAHEPSMLQDVRRGRPTEIEALNGAVVRLAAQAGLDAPANTLITRLIRAKERWTGGG